MRFHRGRRTGLMQHSQWARAVLPPPGSAAMEGMVGPPDGAKVIGNGRIYMQLHTQVLIG